METFSTASKQCKSRTMSHIEEDDDDFLYGDDAKPAVTTENGAQEAQKEVADQEGGNNDEDNEGNDEDEDEEDSESDSDIEFIIGSEDTKEAKPTDETPASKLDAQTAAGVVPEAIGETIAPTSATPTAPASEQAASDTVSSISRVPGIDINKVGEFEGKPITSINLQDLKEKPWRQPGADVSEYFNFGFNELTWTMYCAKQDNMRAQFNPQKAFMELMPMMMGNMPLPMGMPMPMPMGSMMPQDQHGQGEDMSGTSQDYGSSRNGTPMGPRDAAIPMGPSGGNRGGDGNIPRGPQREFRDRSGDYQKKDFRDREPRHRRRG